MNPLEQLKSHKIISVKRTNPTFMITWNIDIACNYSCSYCLPELHNTNYKEMKTLSEMKDNWHMIYDQVKKHNSIDIAFTGGELTINKDFMLFIKWLRENFSLVKNILLTSNGSASPLYYTELLQYITHLTLSTHLEWMNEFNFFTNVVTCHKLFKEQGDPYRFKIQLMNEDFNEEFISKIDIYEKFLKKNNISYTRKNLQFISVERKNRFLSLKTNIMKTQFKNFDFGVLL